MATSPTGRLNARVLGFGQDPAGELYVLTTNNTGPTGDWGGSSTGAPERRRTDSVLSRRIREHGSPLLVGTAITRSTTSSVPVIRKIVNGAGVMSPGVDGEVAEDAVLFARVRSWSSTEARLPWSGDRRKHGLGRLGGLQHADLVGPRRRTGGRSVVLPA